MLRSLPLARRATGAARSLSSSSASGLSFQLSEQQKSFQELARKFAKEEMMPVAAECR